MQPAAVGRLIACALCVLPVGNAPAFTRQHGGGLLRAVATTPGGAIVMAGQSNRPCGATVLKLSRTGHLVWRYHASRRPPDCSTSNAVAVDHRGDVVAEGDADIELVKLDGRSGRVKWIAPGTPTQFGTFQPQQLVALDQHDDVVLVRSHLESDGLSHTLTVVKRRGADGAELWRTPVADPNGSGFAYAVAVDRHGDVLAGGTVAGRMLVAKLDGASGTERWRHFEDFAPPRCDAAFRDGTTTRALALDAGDDVIAAGGGGCYGLVMKLAGDSGVERWHRVLGNGTVQRIGADGFPSGETALAGLVLTASGDMIVAGRSSGNPDEQHGSDLAVVALSGADGNPLWTRLVDGGLRPHPATDKGLRVNDDGTSVAIDAFGRVAVGGRVGERFFVAVLDASTGVPAWHRGIPGDGSAQAIAIDAGGRVIAGGVTRASGFATLWCGRRGRC